jgi:hypothetical protein
MNRKNFDGRPAPIDILRDALTFDDAERHIRQLYPECSDEALGEACREYTPEAAREVERTKKQLRAVEDLYRRANASRDDRLIDVVQKLADAGDPGAQATMAQYNHPDTVINRVMTWAVIDAAVAQDPFWSKNLDGSYTCKPGALITDLDDLYRSFRDRHPKKARRIAIKAMEKYVKQHPDFARAVFEMELRRRMDEIWIKHTRIALGLDEDENEDDGEEKRITVQFDDKSIKLPRYIVNPGETEEFGDSEHFAPSYAKVRHHRLHAEWMIRVGSVDAAREQLAVNAELLRRAGGNEDALIGDVLA